MPFIHKVKVTFSSKISRNKIFQSNIQGNKVSIKQQPTAVTGRELEWVGIDRWFSGA